MKNHKNDFALFAERFENKINHKNDFAHLTQRFESKFFFAPPPSSPFSSNLDNTWSLNGVIFALLYF